MSSTEPVPDPSDGPAVGGVEPRGEVDGLLYDRETGQLEYQFWHKQLEVLYHLNQTKDRRFELNRLYRTVTGEYIDDPIPPEGWDIVGALGGYRAGKTMTGARWTINSALDIPGSRWLVMGQDFAKAKKTTYKVLYQNLPGEQTHILTSRHNGPEQSPVVVDFNRQDMVLTLINGAQIVLGSADDPGRHAGDEFHGAWLDEPSLYGSELHQIRRMVGSRLSAGRPAVQLWTYTGNGYNPAYDIMERRVDEEEEPINSNIKVVRLSNQANPFIDPETKAKLRRQYEGTHLEKQGLFGGYAAARGLVYQRFNRNDHVLPAEEARRIVEESSSPEWRLFGYDAGWDDPRVIVEFGRNDYGQLIALDEFYEEETHVEDAIKWLRGSFGEGGEEKPEGVMWCEHEPSDIRKFRKAGYRAFPAEKSHDIGIPAVRRRLGTDSTGRVGLLVSDTCESFVSEIQSYKEEHVGKSSADDHILDAARYAITGTDEKGSDSSNSGSGSSVQKA